MASERSSIGAVQDTGHPVFDSTVNLLMNLNGVLQIESISQVHAALLEIYEKEPKSAREKNKEEWTNQQSR